MADNSTPNATPHKGPGPFPAFRLTNGVINASDGDLSRSAEACEKWAEGSAFAVIAGLVLEVGIALSHPPFDSFWEHWGAVIADTGVALGVAGEVLFGKMGNSRQSELNRRTNAKLADAVSVSAEANERAANAELARAELEAKLRPREINQEQLDAIQALDGQFDSVNIICGTDVETKYFAKSLSDAFLRTHIGISTYARSPEFHGTGVLIYDPQGFDGARPKTVGPLIEMFAKSAASGPVHIITEIPLDILASILEDTKTNGRATVDAPLIILGSRFILPPAHWPSSKP
jgi:hypothetical protein